MYNGFLFVLFFSLILTPHLSHCQSGKHEYLRHSFLKSLTDEDGNSETNSTPLIVASPNSSCMLYPQKIYTFVGREGSTSWEVSLHVQPAHQRG